MEEGGREPVPVACTRPHDGREGGIGCGGKSTTEASKTTDGRAGGYKLVWKLKSGKGARGEQVG